MFKTEREYYADSQREKDERFSHRERELLKEWRRRAEHDEQLNELSAATGIVDREILLDLQAYGYDPASAALLRIVPLVLVAWSDGTINSQERRRISQIAILRGLDNEDSGWRKLVRYLEDRPSDQFFQLMLRALRASLDTSPMEQKELGKRELIADCTSVAMAAGGLIGFGRVSQTERATIEQIAAAVGIGYPDEELE
jgi:hypothetical protein